MKKIMCIILSVALLLPVLGVSASACDCDTAPVVLVRGFGSELSTVHPDGTVEEIFPMKTDVILKSVPHIVKALGALALTKNYDAVASGIINVLDTLMGSLRMDSSGASVNNLVALGSSATDSDTHRDEGIYFVNYNTDNTREYVFEYDWRLDPLDVAVQLDSYIQQVKSVTGHGKIVLCSHSEGGNVAAAYLSKYGTKDVEKTLFLSSAFNGLKLVGQLFTRDMSVAGKMDQLEDFLLTLLGNEPAGAIITSLVSVLNDMGILDKVNDELAKLLDAKLEDVYNEYLIDMFATMPGIWAFVPDEYYEAAKASMFGANPKYAALIEKIDTYHYDVQKKLSGLLTSVKSSGVPVCVVAGYGISPIPVYLNSDEQCDMLVDTKYASFGATCARVGDTLEKTDSTYLSPDLTVDASTCLFPDSTWLVKYQEHNSFCAPYCEFLTWLVLYDGQPTISANPAYPQYLICRNHEKLEAVRETDDLHDGRSDIVVILTSLIRLIKQALPLIKEKLASFSK